ncbi:hypothetical protein [Flavobacterium cerinum]|uniref:SMI1/KNR4 family protein n=1 Tax=Flavobacterium cerinum TaxID=2502784 RepID=A0ABY5IPP6_9FLAO|nr:hypothetical protein [Flavobacterium cerinum]UUC44818.1 hypothetical protein NOX80_14425 [Flavobacterium cerinum]
MDYYFESSYLTQEITSGKNRDFVLDVFDHLNDLEENDINTWKHSETSDYYFQQRPIGGNRPFSILDLNITNTDLKEFLLNQGLIPSEKKEFVEDQQMDDYRQNIGNADCFSNTSYAVFFSSVNDSVDYIWFDYKDDFSTESDRLAVSAILNELGQKYAFILIDWYERNIIDLSDQKRINQYLDSLL